MNCSERRTNTKKSGCLLHERKDLRFRFIMQNSGRFDISLMCRCLGVSHSGFYKHYSYASSRKKHKQLVCNAILKS